MLTEGGREYPIEKNKRRKLPNCLDMTQKEEQILFQQILYKVMATSPIMQMITSCPRKYPFN